MMLLNAYLFFMVYSWAKCAPDPNVNVDISININAESNSGSGSKNSIVLGKSLGVTLDCGVLFGEHGNDSLTTEDIDKLIWMQANGIPVDCIDQKDTKSYYKPSPSDIEFRLYITRGNSAPQVLNTMGANSGFNPSLPTVVVIHGFKENADDTLTWMHQIKNKLLAKSLMNIILVQWATLANGNNLQYPQAAKKNVRFVGNELAKLLNNLKNNNGLSTSDIHIIGFSLGAHIAGVAGHKTDLNRITGLDPAGPLFYGKALKHRLDPSDASFVDVIHTNAGVSGYLFKCGHVDFYMNGGTFQKGCDSFYDFITLSSQCSHRRGHQYYVESLDAPDSSYGYLCKDYKTFQKGQCLTLSQRNSVGFPVDTNGVKGVFYMNTQANSPFLAKSISIDIIFTVSKHITWLCHVFGGVNIGGNKESVTMSSVATGINDESAFKTLVTVPSGTDLGAIQISVEYKGFWCPFLLGAKMFKAYDAFKAERYCMRGAFTLIRDLEQSFTPVLWPGSC